MTMDMMKKGGKAKKPKRAKKGSQNMTQNVKVNVKVGDSVLLRKGNAPQPKEVGIAKRLMTPGSVFGGGLPIPLMRSSYMNAPAVAQPLSRLDFISSSDALYNRNRNKYDDIHVPVNPSEIKPDITPSKRLLPDKKAVETPDTGLAFSRAIELANTALASTGKALASSKQFLSSFQGETPRVNDLNLEPSKRAVASQPTPGFKDTKGSLIGTSSGKEEASSQSVFGGSEMPGSAMEQAPILDEPLVSAKPAVKKKVQMKK